MAIVMAKWPILRFAVKVRACAVVDCHADQIAPSAYEWDSRNSAPNAEMTTNNVARGPAIYGAESSVF